MQFERTNFPSVCILIDHETILEILRSLYVHKVSCIKFVTMLMFVFPPVKGLNMQL